MGIQIDGNFGGACGIAGAAQSHLDEIFLLPALPKNWQEGSVTGICAEGGFEVDMTWKRADFLMGGFFRNMGKKQFSDAERNWRYPKME